MSEAITILEVVSVLILHKIYFLTRFDQNQYCYDIEEGLMIFFLFISTVLILFVE